MGHVGSKTRSLGKIFEKPCVRTRGHILSPTVMKLGQNILFYEISDELENGSWQSKNQDTKSNVRKTLYTL